MHLILDICGSFGIFCLKHNGEITIDHPCSGTLEDSWYAEKDPELQVGGVPAALEPLVLVLHRISSSVVILCQDRLSSRPCHRILVQSRIRHKDEQ